jgi:hypothetical protein
MPDEVYKVLRNKPAQSSRLSSPSLTMTLDRGPNGYFKHIDISIGQPTLMSD